MAGYTSGSPGAGQLEIGIALVLQDRFSNQAREASGVIRQLHRDAKMATNANLQAVNTIATSGNEFANRMITGLTRAVTEGSNFVDLMTTVKAITQSTNSQMEILGDTAQTLGLKTMFDSQEIASGMKYLAMAGNSMEEINDMIYGAAYVAGAAGMELGGKGGAADVITNVMRTFSMEGKNAAMVIGDQLTKAALSSNVSISDLAETIKYSGADMVTLGQTLPQVAAMAGTLGNAGIQASMAGTALSNMARYLNKSISTPGYKGAKVLASIGLGVQDFVNQRGEIIDMGLALGKIQDAMEGLAPFEKSRIMNEIFGVRGMRAGVAMMNHLEDYQRLLNLIVTESQGTAESLTAERMSRIAGSIDAMMNSFENLRTTFTEAVEPILSPVFKAIGAVMGLVRSIIDTPVIGPLIAGLTVFTVALWKVVSVVTMLRTRWMILFNDSQITGKSMFRTLIGGWTGATLSAQQYLMMERAIINQRMAGIKGKPFDFVYGNGPVGNIARNKAGKYYDTNTGKFVSTETAKKAAESTKAWKTMSSAMGNAATTAGAAAAGSLGGKLAWKGIGKAIIGVGSKIAGFLSGPIGWAVTGLSIAVPLITSAINKNKKSTDENTASVNNLAGKYQSESDRLSANKNLTLDQEVRAMYQAMKQFAQQVANIKPNVEINLNIDGNGRIQKVLSDSTDNVNLNLGIK